MISTIKTIRQEIVSLNKERKLKLDLTQTDQERKVVSEINSHGYSVVENFLPLEFCNQAITEIERILVEYKEKIWVDTAGSDYRIFGADKVSPVIDKFYHSEDNNRITFSYMRCPLQSGFTLAAKLRSVPNNLGSGGGWHRDSAVGRQVKVILYLCDVTMENGPFQFLKGSHKKLDFIKKHHKYSLEFNQTRFEDQLVQKMIADDPSSLITFPAKAGTALFVDTRGIHRGMPIREGVRYALTNYYWTAKSLTKKMAELQVA